MNHLATALDQTAAELSSKCSKLELVGSRITCNPAPTDTDQDYLVLTTPESFAAFEQELYTRGFIFGGSQVHAGGCLVGDDTSFQSYTRVEENMIVTASEVFFRRFMAATSVAKRLNLLEKADRIALFQAVLYGTEI